jgi:SMC interacting uncharacterized protein involved in chromosome segregation
LIGHQNRAAPATAAKVMAPVRKTASGSSFDSSNPATAGPMMLERFSWVPLRATAASRSTLSTASTSSVAQTGALNASPAPKTKDKTSAAGAPNHPAKKLTAASAVEASASPK